MPSTAIRSAYYCLRQAAPRCGCRNARDFDGMTALDYLILANPVDSAEVRMLLEADADVNAVTSIGGVTVEEVLDGYPRSMQKSEQIRMKGLKMVQLLARCQKSLNSSPSMGCAETRLV